MYNLNMEHGNIAHDSKDLERIRRLRLIDDDFMSVCFDNYNEGAELLLKIILGRDDLRVTQVRSQRVLKNLNGKDICLDILAVDSGNNYYNFEIQRSDEGADRRRARYHSSMLDSHMLESGCKVTDLRENYVIFITEHDVLGGSIPLYRIERKIIDTDELFNDGEHIIYVNGSDKNCSTELGQLMHDFYCEDSKDMIHKELADRVKYYKEDEGGVGEMCKILEDMRNEAEERGVKIGEERGVKIGEARGVKIGDERGVKIGEERGVKKARLQNASRMIADGLDLTIVAKYSGLTLSQVKELAGTEPA